MGPEQLTQWIRGRDAHAQSSRNDEPKMPRGKCVPPSLTSNAAAQLRSAAQQHANIPRNGAAAAGAGARPMDVCLSDTQDADMYECTDSPVNSSEQLLIAKLRECTVVHDFTAGDDNFPQRQAKMRTLMDIVEYVNTTKGVFTERVLAPFMQMVSANILRSLPVGSSTDEHWDAEEDDPALEPAWAHLQHVYELLRKFIASPDSETPAARAAITPRFVAGVVELFNSEDPREREFLKTILHRIYGKVMPLRGPIRRAITHAFCRVAVERTRHNGLSELLEILGSIVNGFSVPLKEEHKALLRRALLPLHTASSMPEFHTQLSFCVVQFVKKDASLADEVVRELLRHWPLTHTRKEVMFLNELEEVVETACASPGGTRHLALVGTPLFKRLARCSQSLHFQVAERALYFWNNQAVVGLFEAHSARATPIFAGALLKNMADHWNPGVQNLTKHVHVLMRDLDGERYQAAQDVFFAKQQEAEERRQARVKRWRQLDSLAERARRRRARTSASMPDLTAIAPHSSTATGALSMDDGALRTSTATAAMDVDRPTDDKACEQASKYLRAGEAVGGGGGGAGAGAVLSDGGAQLLGELRTRTGRIGTTAHAPVSA